MLLKTPRSTPSVKSDRAEFDSDAAYAILDEAYICHIGFAAHGSPVVIPTIHWRIGDQLYFHGSHGSRMAKVMAAGQDICVTVTLVDGLVLARSAFSHSMNYRSVVLFGQAREIADNDQKVPIFDALMDKLVAGRNDHVRAPNKKELTATKLLALTINEGSVKVRSGPPADNDGDMDHPVWAGVLPLSVVAGAPIDDPKLAPGQINGKPRL